MNTLLVSYDLRKVGRNYQPVWDYLRSQDNWCKPLESVYIIQTHKSAGTVSEEMQKIVDSNDRFMVIEVNLNHGSGYNLDSKVYDWLGWN